MLRRQPYWYSRWHSSIMIVFDSTYRQPDLSGVYVLPTYPNPVFELDGVHLTIDSGPRLYQLIQPTQLSFIDSLNPTELEFLFPYSLISLLLTLEVLKPTNPHSVRFWDANALSYCD